MNRYIPWVYAFVPVLLCVGCRFRRLPLALIFRCVTALGLLFAGNIGWNLQIRPRVLYVPKQALSVRIG